MKKLTLLVLLLGIISCKKSNNKPNEANNTITPYDSSANFTGKGGNIHFIIQQHCDNYIDLPLTNAKISLYSNIDSLAADKELIHFITKNDGKVQYNGVIARLYYYKVLGNINNGICIKPNSIITGSIIVKKGILNNYNLTLK